MPSSLFPLLFCSVFVLVLASFIILPTNESVYVNIYIFVLMHCMINYMTKHSPSHGGRINEGYIFVLMHLHFAMLMNHGGYSV